VFVLRAHPARRTGPDDNKPAIDALRHRIVRSSTTLAVPDLSPRIDENWVSQSPGRPASRHPTEPSRQGRWLDALSSSSIAGILLLAYFSALGRSVDTPLVDAAV
jgi:hypothetical protein